MLFIFAENEYCVLKRNQRVRFDKQSDSVFVIIHLFFVFVHDGPFPVCYRAYIKTVLQETGWKAWTGFCVA